MRKSPCLCSCCFRVSVLLLSFRFRLCAGRRKQILLHTSTFTSAQNDGPYSAAQAYLYYVLKDSRGFVIARAPEGSAHQPLSAPQAIVPIGSGFGTSTADAVLSLQLSPDGRYLAIDGTRPDVEWVWVFDTRQSKINLLPSDAQGNFLRWLPAGNGHTFLYGPVFSRWPGSSSESAGLAHTSTLAKLMLQLVLTKASI